MEQVIAKTLPVILCILCGYIIKRRRYLSDEFFLGAKVVVFDFALPALLFMAFLKTELRREHVGFVLSIQGYLLSIFVGSKLIVKIKKLKRTILPYMMTGMALGVLGIPLYQMIFGEENVSNIGLIGIGHELFVWIVYVSFVKIDFAGEKFSPKSIIKIFRSPILISIFLGIAANILGFAKYFETNGILQGIEQTLEYFSQLATPLILLIVGHDIKFNKSLAKEAVILVILRRIVLLSLGVFLERVVLVHIIEVTFYMKYALYTFFCMPPPFSFSTLITTAGGDENVAVLGNNVVVLDIILCIISFMIIVYVSGI